MSGIQSGATRLAVLISILSFGVPPARSADDAPLEPGAIIELPKVSGRIDHFAFDARRRLLYVAALRNDTVEVIDLKEGLWKRSLAGFAEPQGVLYVSEFDRLFVSNGNGNRVDILDGTSLRRMKSVEGLVDADNIRYDAAARKVYVGYGKGALRTLDVATGESSGDIALAGHPEAFELEPNGARIFVNVPDAHHVAVVDRIKRTVVATWTIGDTKANFPMALDPAGRRLFVATRIPARLLVYDIDSGSMVASQSIGGDADDLFFDARQRRLYAICGDGQIDVIRQEDPDHYSIQGTVRTAPRARTGLFVPEDNRIYVAAPARTVSAAQIRSYRIK